ncbi:MAG: hypothetical protein H0W64_00695 [Gammaproteobacteria bacterium]|nr:hypothetical protein [Gammaproteobacteria bacterium]
MLERSQKNNTFISNQIKDLEANFNKSGSTPEFFSEIEELILNLGSEKNLSKYHDVLALYEKAKDRAANCATETATFAFCQVANAQRPDFEIDFLQKDLLPLTDDLALVKFIENRRFEYKNMKPEDIKGKLEHLVRLGYISKQIFTHIMSQNSSAEVFNNEFKSLLAQISIEEMAQQKIKVLEQIKNLNNDKLSEFKQKIMLISEPDLSILEEIIKRIANDEHIDLENYSDSILQILLNIIPNLSLGQLSPPNLINVYSARLKDQTKKLDYISCITNACNSNLHNQALCDQIDLLNFYITNNENVENAFSDFVRYLLNREIPNQFDVNSRSWQQYAGLYNHITQSITADINNQIFTSVTKALMACERYIAYLQAYLDVNDFFNAYATYNVLYMMPDKLFGGSDRPNLSVPSRAIMSKVEVLFDMTLNFQKYNHHISTLQQYLPIPSIASQTLEFCEVGNGKENLGNFCYSVCKQITLLQQFADLQTRASKTIQDSMSDFAKLGHQGFMTSIQDEPKHDPNNNNHVTVDFTARKKALKTLDKESIKKVHKVIGYIYAHDKSLLKSTIGGNHSKFSKYFSLRFYKSRPIQKKEDVSLTSKSERPSLSRTLSQYWIRNTYTNLDDSNHSSRVQENRAYEEPKCAKQTPDKGQENDSNLSANVVRERRPTLG